jgi:hypothetical protein
MYFCVLNRTRRKRLKTRQIKYFAKSKIERRAYSGATSPSLGVCTKLVKMLPEDVLTYLDEDDDGATMRCSCNSTATAAENSLPLALGIALCVPRSNSRTTAPENALMAINNGLH